MKVFIAILIFTSLIKAQWLQDTRVTFDPAVSTTSLNNCKFIASSGNNIYIVWFDDRDGNEEIYFKKSTDLGINWGPDIRLTNSPENSNYPAIISFGQNVRVTWRDNRDGNYEVYYKRSTDGGVNWSQDTRLTNAVNTSSVPSICADGVNEYIVWHDYRDDPNGIVPEIYFKRSTDGGSTWSSDVRLTNAPNSVLNPTITTSNSVLHVAWADYRIGGAPEIFYKRSTDSGNTWSADTQLSNNPTTLVSNNACISSFGNYIHLVWNDNRNFNYEIYYKRSTNNGITWGPDTRMTNASGDSYNASLVSENSLVHFVWYDNRDVNYKIYYKRSTDNGQNWEQDQQLTTDNNGSSSRPNMCVSGDQINISWCDFRDGNSEIYFKRNPTGIVAIPTINTLIPDKITLSQNYPNPFNPVTNIEFRIAHSGFVRLVIYDAVGREVEKIVNENLAPGTYKADWDASEYPSGVYFYRLISGDFTQTKKMILVK